MLYTYVKKKQKTKKLFKKIILVLLSLYEVFDSVRWCIFKWWLQVDPLENIMAKQGTFITIKNIVRIIGISDQLAETRRRYMCHTINYYRYSCTIGVVMPTETITKKTNPRIKSKQDNQNNHLCHELSSKFRETVTLMLSYLS